MIYTARYFNTRRGQFKIQQMAFVLVALMIFFAIVVLFYFTIRIGSLRGDVGNLRDEEARQIIRKLAGTSEFILSSGGCESCIDMDKVLILKERKSYEKFWAFDFLQIRKVYPLYKGDIECNRGNYPDCNTITIINSNNYGSPSDAFVSLCYWKSEKGGFEKCELGRIYASSINLKN